MAVSPDLVERSGDLKRALVGFALRRRFAQQLDLVIEESYGGLIESEAEMIGAVDRLALQHRLRDGRTVVEVFVAEHPELTDEERELLLGWRDVFEGIFEVERRDGDALVLTNLIDDLTYRVRSNVGPSALDPMVPGSFMVTRLVPIGDEWLLSGMSSLLPASDRIRAYQTAADVATRMPSLVFRDPEKLAQGWELQRRDRQHFVDFFGSDLVVLPGSEVAERMRAYMHHRTHETYDADGKTVAERAREEYGTDPPEIDYRLPADLLDAETVGIVYDEVDGLNFYRDFGKVEEAFAHPERATNRRLRPAVMAYLREPSIGPLPFRRLAARSPERASQVFERVLKQPGFSWEHDGEALLREYKADYFDKPVLPSVTPISDKLTRARLESADTDRSTHARRRTARRSVGRRRRQQGRHR
jgi:hypothetical protein